MRRPKSWFSYPASHLLSNCNLNASGGRPTSRAMALCLAVSKSGVVWRHFSLLYHISFLSHSVWETANID